MPEWIDIEGKNIEKAIEKACEELNIAREELKYEVVTLGSSGIFGLVGVRKAKIRVQLPEPNKPNEDIQNEEKITETLSFKNDIKRSFVTTNVGETVEFINLEEKPKEKDSNDHKAIEIGNHTLKKIVGFISEDTVIQVKERKRSVRFNLAGGNAGILIGKRGQTLEALQYLTEKIINKNSDSRVRVEVDIEDYMKNKRENLIRLAEKLAEKAKITGRPATIGQMNAHDRRIVHLALREDHRVRTQSMGDGRLRKLVIFPKKENHRKRNYR